jgi:hypothetical protein
VAGTLAERSLSRPEPQSPPVRLELDQPCQDEDGDWVCALRVLEGDQVVAQDEGTGSDALGAIISAIAGLKWHFDRSGLNARWFFDEERGTGIPPYLPQGLGREFDCYLVDLVEAAVRERAQELSKRDSGASDD